MAIHIRRKQKEKGGSAACEYVPSLCSPDQQLLPFGMCRNNEWCPSKSIGVSRPSMILISLK
eukprot:694277-Pyramimonas_sp.AAC.1